MANRYIDSEMWNDAKFADEFSPEDKFFWLMLLTTRYGNLCGCFSFTTMQMSRDSGYDENSIKVILNRFITKYKVIDYDFDTKEILILNWYKYNWTRSPKFQNVMAKHVAKIKSHKFKEYVESSYERYRIDTVSIPYRYHTNRERESISSSNRESISIEREGEYDTLSPTQSSIVKKTYGRYNNVKLSDEQYEELQTSYPTLYQDYIDRLDRFIGKSGKSYQDHFIVIDSWILEDKKDITTNREISQGPKQKSQSEAMSDEDYEKLLNDLDGVNTKKINNEEAKA